MTNTWRSFAYDCLSERELDSRGRALTNLFFIVVIAIAVAAAVLTTLPSLTPFQHAALQRCTEVATAIFVVEYLLRIWIAPESDPRGSINPWPSRWAYLSSFLGVIDLIVIAPRVLDPFLPVSPDAANIAALLALLKTARYASSLPLVAAVFRNEGRSLLAGLMVLLVLLVLVSGVMYMLERDAQPTTFASIPHTMWWGIVTMATVGYGDMTPVTPLGKIFGGFVMLLGIAMFAVPAGILATGFANEVRKRDFVVTWHTVAKVPLFAALDATRIAGIARLLKTQIVPAHQVIVRRGEPADAMFFIMSGEVQVDLQPTPVRLGTGQYFGEIALIRETLRTATVMTLRECQLLVLDAKDFRELTSQHPDLKEAIARVAAERLQQRTSEPPPQEG
ncbi:MAG TPA: cyclic nucleotide-gated ion channel [Candidatus Cybelea sp.]|nr:cyclic nucleotide-gated ion channel [Candidatus Cybelea sp.]